MKAENSVPKDVDEYIAQQPEGVRGRLKQMRAVVRQAAPDAEESISYMMPTFKQNGVLVHFAAFKNHIGLYPAPRAIEVFKAELAGYKGAKGSVQFPHDEPLPLELVRRIVEFRLEQNLEKAGAKKPKSTKPNGVLKICANGHEFFKSSDCPTCPICEEAKKPKNGFLATLSAPARRALEANGITTVQRLAEFSEKEILALHGVGKASLPAFRAALDGAGLGFKK